MIAVVLGGGSLLSQESSMVNHADCSFFTHAGRQMVAKPPSYELSRLTERVVGSTEKIVPGGSRTRNWQDVSQMPTIDSHVFQAIQAAGAIPAGKSDDYTFIRRVSLDITGRVPTYDRVNQFVADGSADKRSKLIDELLNRPEYTDKWTMYFGDLFKNVRDNTQVLRFVEGANAFYTYIKNSVAANKPYNTMVTEMIAGSGGDSWAQGELNWNVGGLVSGGPRTGQDNFDQMAANVSQTFLGIGHMNCVLCHDGRRHLDPLSVWGKSATRLQAWEMAAYFAKTNFARVRPDPNVPVNYYRVVDQQGLPGYQLNTTTGNRPERAPVAGLSVVTPRYPFSGVAPAQGEPPRLALARAVTGDLQFARATVNYFWKEFFGKGLVEPVDQFDPARLDPDNPPPAPWTLQPSNPRLLDAMARDFVSSNYDIKALIRRITNSEAYQMASIYEGTWNANWENLFARKFVRRMWAEEVADAIAQTSNLLQTYQIPQMPSVASAMQLPEPRAATARLNNIGSFLDSFLRGNRIDQDRRQDVSAPQALNLMNDTFVHNRTRASGNGATASFARQLLNKYTSANNDGLIQEMFLTVLTRKPGSTELAQAQTLLAGGTTNALRQQKVEDLLWAVYNKVDFLFIQ